jgi:hypothetical protein
MNHHPGSFQGGFIGRPGYFAPDDPRDVPRDVTADICSDCHAPAVIFHHADCPRANRAQRSQRLGIPTAESRTMDRLENALGQGGR